MSRRDGFPTNNELVARLEQAGRDWFVVAYQSLLPLNGDFRGKPLTSLTLNMDRDVSAPGSVGPNVDPVIQESLRIVPLSVDHTAIIEGHLKWRDKQDIVKHRLSTAKSIGTILLTDNFRVDELVPEALVTSYRATMQSGRQRYVDTLSDKPTKQTLYAAHGVFEDLINESSDQRYVWKIHLSPDLAVSGEESTGFLLNFCAFLIRERVQQQGIIARLKTSLEARKSRQEEFVLRHLTRTLENRSQDLALIEANLDRVVGLLNQRE